MLPYIKMRYKIYTILKDSSIKVIFNNNLIIMTIQYVIIPSMPFGYLHTQYSVHSQIFIVYIIRRQ